MNKESQPQRHDHLRRAQAIGLKAAGLAMIPLGVLGIVEGANIDAENRPQEHSATQTEKKQPHEQSLSTKDTADQWKAAPLALGGVGSMMGGFLLFTAGVARGREREDSKGYIHEVHPWKATNIYVSGEPLTNDKKREITLPHRKTRFIK
jgi:hypothetical protein